MKRMPCPQRRPVTGVFAVVLLVLGFTEVRADSILSDNLSAITTATATAEADTWFAASFATDGSDYQLISLTLLLQRTSLGGDVEVDLYTDGGLQPGSLLGALTATGGVSSSLQPVDFTASDIFLASNSTYWVVLHASTGSFDWAWTEDNSGTGNGFRVTWSESDDAGATWFTTENYPFQMRVTAAAVPEPSSLVLAAMGSGVLLFLRLRPAASSRRRSLATTRPTR